jgi:glycosyltransferase involved in cell wall biosynthesis
MNSHPSAPWLSILLPVYNVAPFVRPCVESILGQLPDQGVEVLLLNDASTDDSGRVCEDLAAAHPHRLRVLAHARNGGLSAARNTLLEAATGRYVWFVDSDDSVLPGSIRALQEIVGTHDPDIILCDYRSRGQDTSTFSGPSRVLAIGHDDLVRGIFARGRMYAWAKIARRELWGNDLRFPVGRVFEDIVVMPRLCLRARTYYHMPEPWIEYRTREGSITSSVARTHSGFDERRNDDLAAATQDMATNPDLLSPATSAETRDRISAFVAVNFIQIAGRALRAGSASGDWKLAFSRLRHYRESLEGCSPVPFARVLGGFLRRRQFKRGLELMALLLIVRQRSIRHPSPVI